MNYIFISRKIGGIEIHSPQWVFSSFWDQNHHISWIILIGWARKWKWKWKCVSLKIFGDMRILLPREIRILKMTIRMKKKKIVLFHSCQFSCRLRKTMKSWELELKKNAIMSIEHLFKWCYMTIPLFVKCFSWKLLPKELFSDFFLIMILQWISFSEEETSTTFFFVIGSMKRVISSNLIFISIRHSFNVPFSAAHQFYSFWNWRIPLLQPSISSLCHELL